MRWLAAWFAQHATAPLPHLLSPLPPCPRPTARTEFTEVMHSVASY